MPRARRGDLTARRHLVTVPGLASALILGTSSLAFGLGGQQLWVARYDALGNGTDQALAIAASPGGSRVFVTGYTAGLTGGDDYGTVAYDASTGAQLWGERYNGPGNGDDIARAIAVGPDGSKVFVTGGSAGTSGSLVFTTVAYDGATGTRLWVARHDDPDGGQGFSAAVSPDGTRVFVTGDGTGAPGTGLDYATVAYDTETGAERWEAAYNGSGDSSDVARSVRVSPDGSRVFVTGTVENVSSGSDYGTVAYDAQTGVQLWGVPYNGPRNSLDYGNALAVSPGGSVVFVTGQSDVLAGDDYGTVAYDTATGSTLWTRRYNGPGNGNDAALAIAVSPGGASVFVTGQSDGTVGFADYATVAYDAATGAGRWVARYDGPAHGGDYASSVVASPGGSKVFVTGQSYGAASWDFVTAAYTTSTGARMWLRRYDGPVGSFDAAWSIAVSPGGSRVFVAGPSTGSGGDDDYATVAYSA